MCNKNLPTMSELKYGAVRPWCIGEGYEGVKAEDSFLNAAFSKNGEITGFIFEFDKTVDEMLSCIEKAKEKVQYIYIVIDNGSKIRNLKKILPEFCGIFCNSNAFGLGMVTQIMKQATFIFKEGVRK